MVIYEDNHLLVINKSCGELVQSDKTRDPTILDKYKDYIKKKYKKPGEVFLHPTHRLDRPVSGCVILARTSKALRRMNDAFRKNEVEKLYHAISNAKNTRPDGQLSQYLIKDAHKNISKIAKEGQKNAKLVELNFELIAVRGSQYLYAIQPRTGRSHQIRVQLSSIGSPVIGDLKYGGTAISDSRRIYLHCSAMTFMHPVKKEKMTVSCLPEFKSLWDNFRGFLGDTVIR